MKGRERSNSAVGLRISMGLARLLTLLMLFSKFGCQSLQKDKMGEAYSEIGKKGEVSGTFLFKKGRYNDAKNFPSHIRGSHYNTHKVNSQLKKNQTTPLKQELTSPSSSRSLLVLSKQLIH